jgi:lysophospholipase L1-like esterase
VGDEVEALNGLIMEMATEKTAQYPKLVAFVDMYAECVAAGGDRLFEDGLHPNAKGHFVIAETFYQAIMANKFVP